MSAELGQAIHEAVASMCFAFGGDLLVQKELITNEEWLNNNQYTIAPILASRVPLQDLITFYGEDIRKDSLLNKCFTPLQPLSDTLLMAVINHLHMEYPTWAERPQHA